MARLMFASVFMCTLAAFSNAAAVPVTNSVVPEVVPGPGLPSLASLGLTSADLYSTSPNLASRGLQKRFDAYCMTFDTCNVNDATAVTGWCKFDVWGANLPRGSTRLSTYFHEVTANTGTAQCYNYLLALGTTNCGVTENGVFCTAGAAAIGGSSVNGGRAGSACQDVATGALWSIQNCNVNSNVQGIGAAYGNGNLAVWVQGTAVD